MFRKLYLFISLVFLATSLPAQTGHIHLSDTGKNALLQLIHWEIFNAETKTWDSIQESYCIENRDFNSIVKFRKKLIIDSGLVGVPLTINVYHFGASDFFMDGKKIGGFGIPANQAEDEICINPKSKRITYAFLKAGTHWLEVNYSNHLFHSFYSKLNESCAGFEVLISKSSSVYSSKLGTNGLFSTGFLIVIGILFALGLLHCLIYFFYKKEVSNLYFAVFTTLFALLISLFEIAHASESPRLIILSLFLRWRLLIPVFYFLLQLVFAVADIKKGSRLRQLVNIVTIVAAVLLFGIPNLYSLIIFALIALYTTFSCILTGMLISRIKAEKGNGIRIVKMGLQIFIYFAAVYFVVSNFLNLSFASGPFGQVFIFTLLVLGILSLPISMSTYLAFMFTKNNRDLILQLHKVEKLSELTIQQEKEKKLMLEKQNEELESQVKIRTAEVVEQREELAIKNKEIIDSINYARKIQHALLAHKELLQENLPEHFILFQPKDIVSGDFYWATKTIDKSESSELFTSRFFLAVCDSTGHGVPGAFMSLLNIGFLTEAINEKKILNPGEVFNFVRERLIHNLSREEQKDGFDGVLLLLPEKDKVLQYAAANCKPVIIRAGNLLELEADRMPVGMGERKNNFNTFSVKVEKGDVLYIYTDGFADQFGGPKGKKFKYKNLNEFLKIISYLDMNAQRDELKKMFEDWKGELEQVDDVCVVGIKF
ncbi:MAG: SpoIIE family protein phosphatase [Sphingobacteriaceae bacterium]|nr:SpoIIE family protein phosphatase [Sphingobacteriaceae bacterium]